MSVETPQSISGRSLSLYGVLQQTAVKTLTFRHGETDHFVKVFCQGYTS